MECYFDLQCFVYLQLVYGRIVLYRMEFQSRYTLLPYISYRLDLSQISGIEFVCPVELPVHCELRLHNIANIGERLAA